MATNKYIKDSIFAGTEAFKPPTAWALPEYPNLRGVKKLALDLETKDDGIQAGTGPGAAKGQGYVAGIAIATEDNQWYFPVNHESGVNLDPDNTWRWLQDTLDGVDLLINHNIQYDLEWLKHEGIRTPENVYCTMGTVALIDENRRGRGDSFSLDACAKEWLGVGKDDTMTKWLMATYGDSATKQGGNIWRAPATVVGPYAEIDARRAYDLYTATRPILAKEGLLQVAAVEFGLIPLLVKMKFHGVAVNLDFAVTARNSLLADVARYKKFIHDETGVWVDAWDAVSIEKALLAGGVQLTARTAKSGKFSITADILGAMNSPVPRAICSMRDADKMVTTFLDNYVIKGGASGRIHACFHALGSDEGGAVSGRFSSSDPNLQNLPAVGPLRECFVPDHPEHRWWRLDQSQIEYRLMAHEAVGPGSDEIRHKYSTDPKADYHVAAGDLIFAKTGIRLERTPIKRINFGLAYGMMPPKLAAELGMTLDDATPLFSAYHQGLPFVQRTFNKFEMEARAKGEVRTILGRRRRFDLWGNRRQRYDTPLPREKAAAAYGEHNLVRSGTHKGLNQRLQGGGADVMKVGMLNAYRAGLYDKVGLPLITVHDELGISAAADNPHMKELQECLENPSPIKLSVPLMVDMAHGATWGNCK